MVKMVEGADREIGEEEAVIKAVFFVVQCDKCGAQSCPETTRSGAVALSQFGPQPWMEIRDNKGIGTKKRVAHLCPTCADAAMGFEQLKLPFEEIEIEVMV